MAVRISRTGSRGVGRPIRRVAMAGIAVLVGVVALTGSAIAGPGGLGAGPDHRALPSASSSRAAADDRWVRYPAESFTSPAGDLCRFTLQSTPVFDQVYVRTTGTFVDGSPRRQEFSGPLQVRLADTGTGRAIDRDLSGYAVAVYFRDGSYELSISGPAAVGFRTGDSLPRGYYRLTGFHRIRFDGDGRRTVLVDRGGEENLCRALGPQGARG